MVFKYTEGAMVHAFEWDDPEPIQELENRLDFLMAVTVTGEI